MSGLILLADSIKVVTVEVLLTFTNGIAYYVKNFTEYGVASFAFFANGITTTNGIMAFLSGDGISLYSVVLHMVPEQTIEKKPFVLPTYSVCKNMYTITIGTVTVIAPCTHFIITV